MAQDKKIKVLFVCNFNMMRSPTGEKVFEDDPRFETKSAGVDKNAMVQLELELLEWADTIFVMEERQSEIIDFDFGEDRFKEKIHCLNIPDVYEFMDSQLVEVLKQRVESFFS